MQSRLVLKKGREKSVVRRHPWVFSGAVDHMTGNPQPGDTVIVTSSDGKVLGAGAFSPASQIRARMWALGENVEINGEFYEERIGRAVSLRDKTWDATRIVHAESDGLPGIVIDRYGDWVVVQLLTAGAEAWKEELVEAINTVLKPRGIWERSDTEARKQEGLAKRSGLLAGEEPPEMIEIAEGECRYLVDVRQGHKTGFYLDQSVNRALVKAAAPDADMLNVFAYTGGFGIAALKGGARHVLNIESSVPAIEHMRQHTRLNGLDEQRMEVLQGDAFQELRVLRDAGRLFDIVVLDPPKFADSASQVERACRGYKDINLLGMKLLKPGGTLFTFSCSGRVEEQLFQKVVADAAVDAGRDALVMARLGQAPDHPTAVTFPEGAYLKGFKMRVW